MRASRLDAPAVQEVFSRIWVVVDGLFAHLSLRTFWVQMLSEDHVALNLQTCKHDAAALKNIFPLVRNPACLLKSASRSDFRDDSLDGRLSTHAVGRGPT